MALLAALRSGKKKREEASPRCLWAAEGYRGGQHREEEFQEFEEEEEFEEGRRRRRKRRRRSQEVIVSLTVGVALMFDIVYASSPPRLLVVSAILHGRSNASNIEGGKSRAGRLDIHSSLSLLS